MARTFGGGGNDKAAVGLDSEVDVDGRAASWHSGHLVVLDYWLSSLCRSSIYSSSRKMSETSS
jgi:hypothetical protein